MAHQRCDGLAVSIAFPRLGPAAGELVTGAVARSEPVPGGPVGGTHRAPGTGRWRSLRREHHRPDTDWTHGRRHARPHHSTAHSVSNSTAGDADADADADADSNADADADSHADADAHSNSDSIFDANGNADTDAELHAAGNSHAQRTAVTVGPLPRP